MFEQVKQSIQNFIIKRLPLARRTVSRGVQTYGYQFIEAPSLDVNQVQAIIFAADDGDPRQLFALYEDIIIGDSHLQGEFSKRKLAVLGDPWTVQPADKKKPDDVVAAALLTSQLQDCASFKDACAHLMESCLYPVAVVEKVYRVSSKQGLRYEIDQLVPVPHRILNYVNTRRLRICDTDPEWGEVLATTHMADPVRYIVHRSHLLSVEDHRGGPMRSLVFWSMFVWYARQWWVRYLDRYGSPFLVGKYNQGDDASRSILLNAFSNAAKVCGVVISRETDVEIKEAAAKTAGEAYSSFIMIAQREKSKLIIGQTTSADAQAAGGIGSGIGESQSDVRDDIRVFDGAQLGNTLLHQVCNPFLEINNLSGRVKFVWGAEDEEDSATTAEALSNLSNAGIEVDDSGLSTLSQRMGLTLRRKAAPAGDVTGTLPRGPLSTFDARQSIPSTTGRAAVAVLGGTANGDVARAASAAVAQGFRGALAPVRQILAESADPHDFERRLKLYYADWDSERLAAVLELALQTHFLNGLAAVTAAAE